jgi:hypothetical protein
MTTAAQVFSQIGRALYGDHFKAPMAAALEVSVDRVDDWSKGRANAPPTGVWRDLVQILDDRVSGLPRLRTAALAIANAAGLRVEIVTLDGLHVVVRPNNPSVILYKGSLASCEQFVAKETEQVFQAAAAVAPADIWQLAERVAKEASGLALEVRRRGLSKSLFDEENFSGVLSHVFLSIGTGDRKTMMAALGALEALRLRLPIAASTNAATRQPAHDLGGNKPTGPERVR